MRPVLLLILLAAGSFVVTDRGMVMKFGISSVVVAAMILVGFLFGTQVQKGECQRQALADTSARIWGDVRKSVRYHELYLGGEHQKMQDLFFGYLVLDVKFLERELNASMSGKSEFSFGMACRSVVELNDYFENFSAEAINSKYAVELRSVTDRVLEKCNVATGLKED